MPPSSFVQLMDRPDRLRHNKDRQQYATNAMFEALQGQQDLHARLFKDEAGIPTIKLPHMPILEAQKLVENLDGFKTYGVRIFSDDGFSPDTEL